MGVNYYTEKPILIAEDSKTQALRLQLLLEENGYEVIVAYDGRQAWQYLNNGLRPAIVISDVEMPNMTGYELCEAIKKDDKLSVISVLLLTSLSAPEDIIKGLNCNANNFMNKPFESESLLARIRYILTIQESLKYSRTDMSLNISFGGNTYTINSDRIQIIDLLLESFNNMITKYRSLESENQELKKRLKL